MCGHIVRMLHTKNVLINESLDIKLIDTFFIVTIQTTILFISHTYMYASWSQMLKTES
jgi:hypothetical protein